jgi:hypothetical protein
VPDFLLLVGWLLIMVPTVFLTMFGLLRVVQIHRSGEVRQAPRIRIEGRLGWLFVVPWLILALMIGLALLLR